MTLAVMTGITQTGLDLMSHHIVESASWPRSGQNRVSRVRQGLSPRNSCSRRRLDDGSCFKVRRSLPRHASLALMPPTGPDARFIRAGSVRAWDVSAPMFTFPCLRSIVPLLCLVLGAAVPAMAQPAVVTSRIASQTLLDLPYVTGAGDRQRLDLYLPAHAPGSLPLVVWVHGGGWESGSRRDFPGEPLVARGYAVASVGYRLSQEAKFPAQIEDGGPAFGSPENIARMGDFLARHLGAVAH